MPRTWPGSWPSERSLSWWKLSRDCSRRSPSSSLRCGVLSLSRVGVSWVQNPGKGVLPLELELVGRERQGQSCVGASIPSAQGAGMWSREQPGLPRQWEPRGVCRALPAPRCCCFRVRHRQEEPYKGQVKNQERFLLHPRASSIPGCSLECSQCPGNNISALAFSGASGRWEWPAPSQR